MDFNEFKVRVGEREVGLTGITMQAVLVEIESAGWKQVGKTEDKSDIKEEEVRSLFNLIDKDKSGSLSRRVISIDLERKKCLRSKNFQEAKKAAKLIKDRFGIEEVNISKYEPNFSLASQ